MKSSRSTSGKQTRALAAEPPPRAGTSLRTAEAPRSAAGDASAIRKRNTEVHAHLVAAAIAREVPDELLAPDFHMENHAAAAVDYTYWGATGWREWMSDLFEVFAERPRYRVEEVIAMGDDFIAATFCVDGTSVRSGNWLVFRWAGVTWFRDGKATRAIGYSSRAAALEAVELQWM